MTHTVESLMALVETYADRHHRYLGFANYESEYDFQASKGVLYTALFEVLQAAQPVAHPDYTLLRQALEALLPHKSNALRWYTPVDAAIDALRARLESV